MENLWERSQPLLKTSISEKTYERWVQPIKFRRVEGERLFLQVPSAFFRDYLQEGFLDLFRRKVHELAQQDYQIVLELPDEDSGAPPERRPQAAIPPAPEPQMRAGRLNSKYAFETFVVGKSNQFAHAACWAVAEKPYSNNYNPLFLFGGVGLGKTHLVNAIGHQILRRFPRTRIVYVSSENFTNEVISSIQHNRMEEFKRKYRNECDVLLIDDIQFIAGKQATEEEFFHTFEELHNHGRQIVVTSDRPAREIGGLEERLKSRLDWGLAVDVQPPELETKVAILRRKAEVLRFTLPDDVAHFLATYCGNNMRELEGSLTRVLAWCDLNQQPAKLEAVQELFQHAVEERSRKPTIEAVQDIVAEQYNVKVADLKSPRKLKVYALPRQVAMYLCREFTGASYPEIGEKFGGKDHATVIHAYRKIQDLLQEDSQLRHRIQSLQRSLGVRNQNA